MKRLVCSDEPFFCCFICFGAVVGQRVAAPRCYLVAAAARRGNTFLCKVFLYGYNQGYPRLVSALYNFTIPTDIYSRPGRAVKLSKQTDRRGIASSNI